MSQFYLVAPSGYCVNQEAAHRGVQRLQEAGHQVLHQEVIPAASSGLPELSMSA
jgi:muramoyltetrapeptide carboxypeptidase